MDLSGSWQGYFAGTNRGIVCLDLLQQDLRLNGPGTLTDFDWGPIVTRLINTHDGH